MKIVMTASRSTNTAAENCANNNDMLARLETLPRVTVQAVTGYWQGERESSYIFHGVDAKFFDRFITESARYDQDAILIIRDDKRCHLVTREGDIMDIGNWIKVRKEIAVQFDGYTHDAHNNEYWVAARPEDIAAKERRLLATAASVIAAEEYAARINAVEV